MSELNSPTIENTQGRVKDTYLQLPIVYGSKATPITGKRSESGNTHDWSVFLRGIHNEDLSYIIRKVVFKLHDSFEVPTRVFDNPPYEVNESGWGEFDILIKIYFVDPNEKPLTVVQPLRLYPGEGTVNHKGSVLFEQYDEIVFYEPTENVMQIFQKQSEETGIPIDKVPQAYVELETKEIFKLQEAIDKIQAEIDSVQKRLLEDEKRCTTVRNIYKGAMSELRFDGKVVIITGAGGGLGKTYALLFASKGASVVVNDLGASKSGEGKTNAKAADVVVQEIIEKGGKAVANYDSVEDGEKIVDTAMKAFGRIDVIINNAGILRDKSFARMSDDDWNLIMRVHLNGSYKLTKAAWPIFLKQKYGRVVMTSSAAGIYGNYGQANYSAAKLALAGFAFSLAREGAKSNILVNTIAPLAASRMTEAVLPPDLLEALKPEYVAPVVCYLSHDTCTETGGLFEIGAGYIGKLRWERSQGLLLKSDKTLTPAVIAKHSEKVFYNFQNAEYPTSITEKDWIGLIDQGNQVVNEKCQPLRFDGRVAVVTGAGAGLGKAYALLFASLGASVVVNDLGVSTTGSGSTGKAADAVVDEIRKLGAKAVANYDSVENGDKIVETAMKAFGRVDIVVNNAGILRDKSFVRATDDDWNLIHRVHLNGTYKVTKAAWPIFMKQNYGRVINTASAVGLYGNFGQANYSSAKLGIVGFSNSLAAEGKKFNIVVNCIAPNAGTRMTATVLPPEIVEALKPDFVAPYVAFLAHESNTFSGGVFEVGSGWIGRVRWQRAQGVAFPKNQPFSVEDVARNWDKVTAFDNLATYPTNTGESLMGILESKSKEPVLSKASTKSSNSNVKLEEARKACFPPTLYEVSSDKVIEYNLGIGASATDLKYVLESHPGFSAIPSFGAIPAFPSFFNAPVDKFIPKFNPMNLVHGEHFVQILKPIPLKGKLSSQSQILDIIAGKGGKSVSVALRTTTKDEKGNVIFINEATTVIGGVKATGIASKWTVDRPKEATAANEIPKRAPDAIVKQKIPEEQAALYRLSGDRNPLHINPTMAAMGGFDKPILHGLCTFGYATRHVLQAMAGDDARRIESIKVRFKKHVFPGETIQTKMWRESENRIVFQTEVLERNEIAISNAAITLTDKLKKIVEPIESLKSLALVKALKSKWDSIPSSKKQEVCSKIDGVIEFDVVNASGDVYPIVFDMKQGNIIVNASSGAADVKLNMEDEVFISILQGKLPPGQAFMNAKFNVDGDFMLLGKLELLLALFKSKL